VKGGKIMTEQLTTLLLSVLIAVISLGGVFGLIYASKKNKKLLPVLSQITDVLPMLIGVAQSVVTKGDKADPSNKTFEVLKQIAEASASSVEQVYKKESHLTSEEKMQLAKENFSRIAETVGVNPSELDDKVVETLIENVVFHLDK
jgi:esterase/lipase